MSTYAEPMSGTAVSTEAAAAAGDPSEVICATWVSACVTDASTLRRG